MTAHIDRGDSGTQPTPHYCTQRLTDDGTITGCAQWPACLFPNLPPAHVAARVERFQRIRAASAALDRTERHTLWWDAWNALGWALAIVSVLLIIAAVLLPMVV